MSAGGHSFHKKDWAITAALLGAAALGGPALMGAMGGTAGAAGAAGAAGEALGGAAAGAAGTAGGTAGMFGPSAGLAGSLLAPAEVAPMFTGADLMGAGASAFGPDAAGMGMLGALEGPGAGTSASLFDNLSGMSWKKGLKGLQMAQKMGMLGGQQQPVPGAGPPPGMRQGGGSGNELAQLAALFSNPQGQDLYRRYLRSIGMA